MTAIIRSYSDASAAVRAERNNRSTRAFSISRVLAAMSGESNSLDGYEAEVLKEIGQATRGYHDPARVQIPLELLADPTISPTTLTRDLNVGTASAGGALVGARTQPVVDIMRPFSTILQAGATLLNGDVSRAGHGNIIIPKVSADMTGYWLSTEGASLTQSDPSFEKVTLTPKTGGVLTKFTRLLAKQGNVADAVLQQHLLRIVGSMIDKASLAGTGADGQPRGLLNTSGLASSTAPSGATDPALIAEYNASMAGASGFGFVTHPVVRASLRTPVSLNTTEEQNEAASRMAIWKSGPQGDRYIDWPAWVCKECPSDSMVAGPWNDLVIALWGAPILEINPYDPDGFKSGLITARVLLDMDVAPIHPAAWMKFTGINNTTTITVV